MGARIDWQQLYNVENGGKNKCRNNSVYDKGRTQIRISKTIFKSVLREMHNYFLTWTKGWMDHLLQDILEGLKVHTTHIYLYTHTDMHGNLYPIYEATREWKSKWIYSYLNLD